MKESVFERKKTHNISTLWL